METIQVKDVEKGSIIVLKNTMNKYEDISMIPLTSHIWVQEKGLYTSLNESTQFSISDDTECVVISKIATEHT